MKFRYYLAVRCCRHVLQVHRMVGARQPIAKATITLTQHILANGHELFARANIGIPPDGYGEQLFDLLKDPDEQHNLVVDPAYSETRINLRDRLLDFIIEQDYSKTRRDLFELGIN